MRILVSGALGEVGRSVSQQLTRLGHDVLPVSSRASAKNVDLYSLDRAREILTAGRVDLVVHAGGRGDKRVAERDPTAVSAALGRACEDAGVRGILISTVRVLEGATKAVRGSAAAECHTDYALANAENERAWLASAPSAGHVVRLANYFCAPMTGDSPQTALLPWSLVTEAIADGCITVRSDPSVSREFVSADDVARAILAMGVADAPPKVASTLPGLRLSMEQLTECVCEAFRALGHPGPRVSFGSDRAAGPTLLPDWLAEQGWASTLTASDITDVIVGWLSEQDFMQQ